MVSSRRFTHGVIAGALLLLSTQPLQAQDANAASIEAAKEVLAKESYVRPPEVIQKLVTAPRHLVVSLTQPSPDRRYFLKEQSEGLPSVTAFGKPHIYFAGLQVDPAANRARSLTTRGASGLSVIDATTGAPTVIETPKNATVTGASWSPDGKQLAYIANFETASHVFVADLATKKSAQVTKAPLLATLVTSIDWTADGKNVVVVLIPEPRSPQPPKPAVATPSGAVVDRREAIAAAHVLQPARGALRSRPDGVVRDRAAGCDRREDESGAEDWISGDDPECRCVARWPVLPRQHDAEALLVRGAIFGIPGERGAVGRYRQRCSDHPEASTARSA